MRTRHLAILLPLVLSLLLIACGGADSATPDETAVAAQADQDEGNVISATGEVRPARWANLSFPIGGRVRSVLVNEGQPVTAGQPLVELEAVHLGRAVAEAQAALSAAEANLAQVKAGPHPQDVAAAEQAVAAAQANEAVAGAQIQAAEAELERAQTSVSTASAQVAIAQAGVKIAQAELARAQAKARTEDLAIARAALDKARAAVRLAQAEYDRTNKSSDTPEALVLEQATLDLKMAEADYDRLLAGARTSDLAPLRAGIEAAQSQVTLAEAQAAQAKSQVTQAEAALAQASAGLEAAQAQTAQAQAALDRLRAGATAEQVAVAEAAVAQSQEALLTTQAMLDQATLTAPFDGTTGLIYFREGEEVTPGEVVMALGDLSTLRVETTDLDEIDVARVEPGQRVDLTFDALPNKVLVGRVDRVAPMSTPGQTSTTYKVVILFEEADPALLWGMTAFADIEVE
jgi:multidrug efflux pump subunit AcrA (membrane-fusion protein)